MVSYIGGALPERFTNYPFRTANVPKRHPCESFSPASSGWTDSFASRVTVPEHRQTIAGKDRAADG